MPGKYISFSFDRTKVNATASLSEVDFLYTHLHSLYCVLNFTALLYHSCTLNSCTSTKPEEHNFIIHAFFSFFREVWLKYNKVKAYFRTMYQFVQGLHPSLVLICGLRLLVVAGLCFTLGNFIWLSAFFSSFALLCLVFLALFLNSNLI